MSERANPTLKFGDVTVEISDPNNIAPVSGDVFTELWNLNGIVHLAFASLIKDGDAVAHARVVSRVRINMATVQDLYAAFGDMLSKEMPGKEKAN